MLTDVLIATAPAGFGGTGTLRVSVGGASAVPTVGMRPWTGLPGTGLPCVGLLERPAGVEGRTLPAGVPAAGPRDVRFTAVRPAAAAKTAPPVIAPTAVPQNVDQKHAGSQITGTQIGTTLGIHSPGRPQS